MHYLMNFILLSWITFSQLTVGLIDIQNNSDDLREENKICSLDTCSHHLNHSVMNYACHCEADCVRFGTCCLDSHYINAASPALKSTCRRVYHGPPCFMVDRCPTNDSVWESECREDSYGEEDMLKKVPVTSLFTSITYKNYFCFRCHETNEDFVYWKVEFKTGVYDDYYESMSSEELQSDFEKHMYSLTYEDGKWIATFRNGLARLPLWLFIHTPEEIRPFVKTCDPDIITNCSAKWTDTEVSEKCHAYMGVREVTRGFGDYRYKNLHCALCNFVDLSNLTCVTIDHFGSNYPVKAVFSFSHLRDINKAGKIQKCDDDHIWDPYVKRCRKLTCALPGYKLKNRKCQPQ